MQSKNELKRTFDQLKLSDRYLMVMSRYASERGTICLIEGKWGTFCQKWYLKGKGLDLKAKPPRIKLC